MKNLTSTHLILIATAVSVVSTLGAWMFEALGYEPCQMCYYQRYPHYAAVVIGAVALLTRQHWLAWAGALAAATTSAVGYWHTGIERKWWPGPASCTGGPVGEMSTEDLVAQLQSAPMVRCDEIPWRLSDVIPWEMLDITMANFNALGSMLTVGVWIWAARRAASR